MTASGQTTTYDADGNRVLTVLPGSNATKIYTPFPDYEIEDPFEGDTITRTTYRLAGQMVAAQKRVGTAAGVFSYTYTDHLGNLVALSSTAGVLDATSLARYDPFGNFRTTPATNPSVTDQGFTGHRHNNTGTNDLGLIYMNARYYMPEIGRFVSPDSIVPSPQEPQSFNRYTYSYNNPINFIDPTGHKSCVDFDLDGCTVTESIIKDGQEWRRSIIVQGSNVVVSTLPAPAGAISTDWYSIEVNYRHVPFLGSPSLSSPVGPVYIYFGFSNNIDLNALMPFEIVARVLLAENYRIFLIGDSRFAQEIHNHWPQDPIAMAYIIYHKAARANQEIAEYVGPNQTANPISSVPNIVAAGWAYAVALGVEMRWLNDPTSGADWYFNIRTYAEDNYLDDTKIGIYGQSKWWEPVFPIPYGIFLLE